MYMSNLFLGCPKYLTSISSKRKDNKEPKPELRSVTRNYKRRKISQPTLDANIECGSTFGEEDSIFLSKC